MNTYRDKKLSGVFVRFSCARFNDLVAMKNSMPRAAYWVQAQVIRAAARGRHWNLVANDQGVYQKDLQTLQNQKSLS
jgi:hypothetical protein